MQVVKTALTLALTGCSVGMGPSTAATRGLLGGPWSNSDAKMWVVASDQTHVPSGMVRIEQVSDGFARVFDYVSITSAVRKGNTSPTVAGTKQDDRDVVELELSLTGRYPLPVGGVSFGAGYVWDIEGDTGFRGPGVKASFAPIAQVSVDVAHSFVHDEETSVSGGHTSLGGTLLLFGINQFRFGLAMAKTWTDVGDYESEGYTYSLVGTMY